MEEIENIIKTEALKQDFYFIYKIVPGMMRHDGRTAQPISFDGFEVHFIIRLPNGNILRAMKFITLDLDKIKETIQLSIGELRHDLLARLK
jgi:hypothetical protein